MTEFFSDNTSLMGFHFGLIFGNFGVGFAGAKSITKINPEGFDNGNLIYGGFDLRFLPMRNSILNIDGRCFIGTGYMDIDYINNTKPLVNNYDFSPDEIVDKNFYLIEPGLSASLYLMENFRVGYGFTYRQCIRDGFESYDNTSLSGISNNLICEIIF
jgi:hypothetical protein